MVAAGSSPLNTDGVRIVQMFIDRGVNVLATDLGGSGGGHDKACGAVVPKHKIKKFITELNKKIK